jgi:hypothetical protein
VQEQWQARETSRAEHRPGGRRVRSCHAPCVLGWELAWPAGYSRPLNHSVSKQGTQARSYSLCLYLFSWQGKCSGSHYLSGPHSLHRSPQYRSWAHNDVSPARIVATSQKRGAPCSSTQPLSKTAYYLVIRVTCVATHCQRPFFLTNTSVQRSSLMKATPLYFPLMMLCPVTTAASP